MEVRAGIGTWRGEGEAAEDDRKEGTNRNRRRKQGGGLERGKREAEIAIRNRKRER